VEILFRRWTCEKVCGGRGAMRVKEEEEEEEEEGAAAVEEI
jgi:hypothetical protein